MEDFALKLLESSPRRPLRSWKSCQHYDALVRKGLAVEVEEPNPMFRKFTIASLGRQLLADGQSAEQVNRALAQLDAGDYDVVNPYEED